MSTESHVVDARGLLCPLPIIELARAARCAAAGDVVVVWWTDPAAEHDIPACARMRGHQVLSTAPLASDDSSDAGTTADRGDVAHATAVRIAP